MLFALFALQFVILAAVVVLILRRPAMPATAKPDPRLEALLGADLPGRQTRADLGAEALERLVRAEIAQLRREAAYSADQGRESLARQGENLRRELLESLDLLGGALRAGLEVFRGDHKNEAERLRTAVDAQINGLNRRIVEFTAENNRQHSDNREGLHERLGQIGASQHEHQERLRSAVEERLDRLNQANTQKLEEMRSTVDEKLHATLQTRLTESFGAVTDQLTKVHTGLGEMSKLSADVGDLSRIFTNVKSRGGFAEVQLGMLLGQMLAPNQYSSNVRVKPNTSEMVEFAVKLPNPNGEVLLPIDAKFPREAWERLESAYAENSPDIATAGRAFEAAIKTEGKRICDKYIAQPVTTNFAIMFLPTEGLYAEVMRRDGLQADLQLNCRVTIAGPSTLSALLNSFQLGFHMLHLQQKGDEVWKVLAGAKTEFTKFETLMGRMEKQVGTVQNTLADLNTRTRAINKSLRDVHEDETSAAKLANGHTATSFDGFLPMLAATEEN